MASKGEKLKLKAAIELAALAELVEKDRTTILSSKEIVKINDTSYYYVQFNENIIKINKLKEQILETWKIQDPEKMACAFEKKLWYKNGITSQIKNEYLDLMNVYKNTHNININIIKMIKKLEALQTDVIVSDIYPKLRELFLKFFKLYQIQKSFNSACSTQAIALLNMYKIGQEWSPQKITEKERKITAGLKENEENFKQEHKDTKTLILNTFKKIGEELDKLSPTASYKVFIVGMNSRRCETERYLAASSTKDRLIATLDLAEYNRISHNVLRALKSKTEATEIEKSCSGSMIWSIERAEIKQLESLQQAFGALFHSIQLIESNWEIKMRIINQNSAQSNAFAKGKAKYKTEIPFLQGCLNRIFYLHATCIQNRRHNIEIDRFFKTESELLDQKIFLMDRGSKVLIQNSNSKQYLTCAENPSVDGAEESQKKCKDSKISFTDASQDERSVWELIDERNGGIMLKNVISKCYLKSSPESHLKQIDVVGNSQSYIQKTHTASKVQLYEGLWGIKKVYDYILQTEKDSNKRF